MYGPDTMDMTQEAVPMAYQWSTKYWYKRIIADHHVTEDLLCGRFHAASPLISILKHTWSLPVQWSFSPFIFDNKSISELEGQRSDFYSGLMCPLPGSLFECMWINYYKFCFYKLTNVSMNDVHDNKYSHTHAHAHTVTEVYYISDAI